MRDSEQPLTISVPEAGKRYFGLCRNAAYDAAAEATFQPLRSAACCGYQCGRWSGCSTVPASRRHEQFSKIRGHVSKPYRPLEI
jgi:hypothetical protein